MRRKLMAILVASTGFAAGAQADTYTCHLNVTGRAKGYISNEFAFSYSDYNRSAQVSDAIALATNGRAVQAVLTINTNERLNIKWELYGILGPQNERVGKVDYKLSLWKNMNNKVSVTAIANIKNGSDYGGPIVVSGEGKCKLR